MAQSPLVVGREDADLLLEALAQRFSVDTRAGERLLEEYRSLPLPKLMPSIHSLAVDPLGFLWSEDFRRPGDALPVWTVFDPEGRGVGKVALPAGVKVLDVGIDHVLGLLKDETGRETVHRFRLNRPRG